MAEPLLAGIVASNRRVVEELRWRPRYPTYREGIAVLAQQHPHGLAREEGAAA